ncbi:MAG: radical SAM family heme chaperone HemW [Mycobacteriales bacterium]
MPGALPPGEPVPASGPLPADRHCRDPLGLYVHVPFCAARCGYCDFNTYTPAELGAGADPEGYLAAAEGEIWQLRAMLEPAPKLATVFVGGGTPTLLEPGQLGRLLETARAAFGCQPGAEITVEANPETITRSVLDGLLEAGVNRLSLGMQSASPQVLATLDRRHSPGRAVTAARDAARAGFGEVSLDLIYGTPGESEEAWRSSLDAALSAAPTHLSAYALVVEPGTRLARLVERGEVPPVDDDVLADRYLVADAAASAAGLRWYEVSNWGEPCRHNLGYWRSTDWLGVGPGAHSHVDGVRWWNRRHPAAYAAAVATAQWPAAGREILDPAATLTERVMLGLRLAEGLRTEQLPAGALPRVAGLVGRGLVTVAADRIQLTLAGRLLADAVVRELLN